jgi:hypothetical protein
MSLKVESDDVLVSEVVFFLIVDDAVFFNILRSLGFPYRRLSACGAVRMTSKRANLGDRYPSKLSRLLNLVGNKVRKFVGNMILKTVRLFSTVCYANIARAS